MCNIYVGSGLISFKKGNSFTFIDIRYMLKPRGICSFSNVDVCTSLTLIMKSRTSFIELVPRVPSTLHGTLTSAWLGVSVIPRTDLRSVRCARHVKQVQYGK